MCSPPSDEPRPVACYTCAHPARRVEVKSRGGQFLCKPCAREHGVGLAEPAPTEHY